MDRAHVLQDYQLASWKTEKNWSIAGTSGQSYFSFTNDEFQMLSSNIYNNLHNHSEK